MNNNHNKEPFERTKIVVSDPTENDRPQIRALFYHSWMATYPNKEIGITEEDIKEHFSIQAKKTAPTMTELEDEKPLRLVKIVRINGLIIGIIRLSRYTNYNQLQSLYVLPEYFGKGIGTALWEQSKNFLDFTKDTIVHVATYNAQAIGFYKKLGFIETGKLFTEERHRMPISGVCIPETELVMPANTTA
jgi:ribosomal protein S18 acetylase RimI-like enzyme